MIAKSRIAVAAIGGVVAAAFALGALTAAPVDAQRPLNADGRLANGAPYSFADLIEQVSPAVVSVDVRTKSPVADVFGRSFEFDFEGLPPEFREFFDRYGDALPSPEPREGAALGSGFIISPDGYVVTNYHVINDAAEVTVALPDGEEYEAEIIGSDESTDLAVLRIRGDAPFPFVEFAADMNLRVGDWVVAVGNPFGLGGTATAGIVSASGREIGGRYNDFIQIDAPINRGNSGGPTFDLAGRVVGVNSQIYSPSGGNVGIGFAIPAPVASRVVDELIRNGRIVRGWLGVTIQTVTDDIGAGLGMEEGRGAIVSAVVPTGPAADAGFRTGDVILEVAGAAVEDAVDLTRRVGDLNVGDTVAFTVLRDDAEQRLNVTIGERPPEDELVSGAVPAPRVETPEAPAEYFGLTLRPMNNAERERLGLSSDEAGLFVAEVEASSEAADQGLRDGEVVLEVNGVVMRRPSDFANAVESARAEGRSAVLLTVYDGRNRRFAALRFNDED